MQLMTSSEKQLLASISHLFFLLFQFGNCSAVIWLLYGPCMVLSLGAT